MSSPDTLKCGSVVTVSSDSECADKPHVLPAASA
jgi:hypothetical protein